jgi:hypothetical protein
MEYSARSKIIYHGIERTTQVPVIIHAADKILTEHVPGAHQALRFRR